MLLICRYICNGVPKRPDKTRVETRQIMIDR